MVVSSWAHRLGRTSGLLLLLIMFIMSGCATYDRKPVKSDIYLMMLAERSIASKDVQLGIDNTEYIPEDGLTLQEAEMLALFLNPELRTERKRADVEIVSSKFAGLLEDPQIDADVLRILENVEEPWIYGGFLSFSVPLSGRLSVAKSKAKAEAEVALVDAYRKEQDILLELRNTWALWEQASRSLNVSLHLHESMKNLLEITNLREELGEIIPAEAAAFQIAEARLRLEIDRLAAEELKQSYELLRLVGLSAQSDVQFVPQSSSKFHILDELDEEDIYTKSPEVLRAEAAYKAAEEGLRLEVRRQFPDFNLGPVYENEEGMDRLGLGFSLPIPLWNRNRGEIARAEGEREVARLEWEEAVQNALSEVAIASATFAGAQQRTGILRETVIPLAQKQIDQARQLVELGELDALLILEAIQSEREAKLDLIAAEAELNRSSAQLRRLIPAEVYEPEIKSESDANE